MNARIDNMLGRNAFGLYARPPMGGPTNEGNFRDEMGIGADINLAGLEITGRISAAILASIVGAMLVLYIVTRKFQA